MSKDRIAIPADPHLDPKRIVIPADPNDPEDFNVTADELEAAHRARDIRMIRTKLGPTQVEFAARYQISIETPRDWEQGRATAPGHVIAYMPSARRGAAGVRRPARRR